MKYFRMSYEEVVYKRSYVNLILLNRAIPGIKPFDKDKEDEYYPAHHSNKCIKRTPVTGSQHANSFFESLMM